MKDHTEVVAGKLFREIIETQADTRAKQLHAQMRVLHTLNLHQLQSIALHGLDSLLMPGPGSAVFEPDFMDEEGDE